MRRKEDRFVVEGFVNLFDDEEKYLLKWIFVIVINEVLFDEDEVYLFLVGKYVKW